MLAFYAVQKMHLTATPFKILLIVLWYDSFDNKFLIVTTSLSFCNSTAVADMEHLIYRVCILDICLC